MIRASSIRHHVNRRFSAAALALLAAPWVMGQTSPGGNQGALNLKLFNQALKDTRGNSHVEEAGQEADATDSAGASKVQRSAPRFTFADSKENRTFNFSVSDANKKDAAGSSTFRDLSAKPAWPTPKMIANSSARKKDLPQCPAWRMPAGAR